MKRNSSRICGRKITTEPTPPHTPSRRSDLSRDAGRSADSHAPDACTAWSTASMSGRAAEKIVWNTATTTARKTSGPATGCRNTASSRRVQTGGAGAA